MYQRASQSSSSLTQPQTQAEVLTADERATGRATSTVSRSLKGILLVLLSACAIATVQTFARLAFDAGSNTLTVVTVRATIGAAIIALFMVGTSADFRMKRSALLLCLLIGGAYGAMSFGFIGSVAYVPVAVAVLVFFTHPVLIAVAAHVLGRERLTRRRLVLALAALVGIAITLGQGMGEIDLRGVMLAALASAAITVIILLGDRVMRSGVGSVSMNFAMTVPVAALAVLVTTIAGAWAFPSTLLGWVGLVGAGVGTAVGMLAFFAAFDLIGPVRATMLSNTEPLLGIVVAAIVLGEHLQTYQWGGVLLVVAALVMFEAAGGRRVKPRR
ncbi:EamA family transporter [Aureimonas ureilytica]|uniref:EamA family transporter n=1 Tax=Aureimonas ureilytica TaxID=401562 RepID=UPI00037CE6CF|nr:DMT family transporter [Aureimonas ureilytica]